MVEEFLVSVKAVFSVFLVFRGFQKVDQLSKNRQIFKRRPP